MGEKLQEIGIFVAVEGSRGPIIEIALCFLIEFEESKRHLPERRPLLNVQKLRQIFVNFKQRLALHVNILKTEIVQLL